MKEAMAELNRHWAEFNELLIEREQEAMEKDRQSDEYDRCKKVVVEWLTDKEAQVDGFKAVAVDLDLAEQQLEELQVCV